MFINISKYPRYATYLCLKFITIAIDVSIIADEM